MSREPITPGNESEHIVRTGTADTAKLVGQSRRRTILALALAGTCVAALSACTTTPTVQSCPKSLSDAVILQNDTFHVDRELDPADIPTVIENLGEAPPPSCAFSGTAADADNPSPYAAIWVTTQAPEADSISEDLATAIEAIGIPLVAEVAGTDSVVNFMEVADDGTAAQVVIRTVSTGSALIGLGAEQGTHLVVLTGTTTPPTP